MKFNDRYTYNMSYSSFIRFEPQSTSTPKKMITTCIIPNLCSTPRPGHIRYSLPKYPALPIVSTNTKKSRKSFAPNIHCLIYPSHIRTTHATKIWIL